MGETSGALGVGGELLGGSDRQGLGGVCAGTEPRCRAGEVPGGPPCGEATSRQAGGAVLAALALLDTEQPAVTCEGGAWPAHAFPDAPARGRGGHAQGPMPRVGGARAPALECCDTHQVRQEPPSRAWGHVEVERLPTEGRDREKRASTGDVVPGTPREVAFDQSMGQGGTHRVRAALGGGTARERGQPCDGGARGLLGLGSTPLHLHVSSHLRASWGHGVAPLEARGIRSETPPAGASTEPLDGRSEDNPARSVLWASVWSMPASERERGHMKGRQKAGENCRAAA